MLRPVMHLGLAVLLAPFAFISLASHSVEIEWQESCPVGASPTTRCAELVVPERRDGKSARTVRVPFAIIPAPDTPAKNPDPLLFLMGGTGSGFAVLQQAAVVPHLINRDVIVIEQRGNPMAKPFYGCESVPAAMPLHRLYNSSVDYSGKASAEACKQDLLEKGMDLQAYTTPYAADDLIDLRRALGIESWNIYGVSYGGRVGTTLMRKDPEAIRSLTIDSAQITGTWFSSWERLKAVDAFFDRCAAAPNCGAQFPNLRKTFEDTLTRLAKKPAKINYAGKKDKLNDYGYMHLVVWSLYQLGLNEMTRLPAAIEAAGEGDFNALLANNDIFGDYKPERSLPNTGYTLEGEHNAQQVAMLCAEEFPYNTDVDEPAEARAAGWGPAVIALLEETERREREVCRDWGLNADDPLQAQPPTGERPTLLVYAEHDTIAPPSHGEKALASLDNAQLIVFPWTAHGVIYERQDCFFPIFMQFLSNPGSELNTACLDSIGEPVWAPANAQPGGNNPLGLLHAELANDVARYGFPARAAWVEAPTIDVSGLVAVGASDISGSTPMTGREVFRIASQTKVFTAAGVLRLEETGQLNLDSAISGMISEAMNSVLLEGGYAPKQITLRQLLNHTAGLPDHSLDPAYLTAVAANPDRQWTALEQVAWGAVKMKRVGDPGQRYVYSDTGYILLGHIIERATGKALHIAMRELLDYERIGLKSTWFELVETPPTDTYFRAEQYASGQPTSKLHPSFDLFGGGGLISTLEDQVTFLRALLGGKVFDRRATLETMLSIPEVGRDAASGDGYALGIKRATISGVECWGHGGFFGSSAFHCPAMDLTVASSRYRAEGHPAYDGTSLLRSAILMLRLREAPADPR